MIELPGISLAVVPTFVTSAVSNPRSRLGAARARRCPFHRAVLVVVRDGHLAFARGYGHADLERRVAVDADRTIFRVASVSKLFTASAAMQLVEQGKLAR